MSFRRMPILSRRWAAVCLLGTSLLLIGCSVPNPGSDPSPVDPENSQPPPSPSAGALTRQETIARGRPLTVRVEVTTCRGYKSSSGFYVGPNLVATVAHGVTDAQTVAVRSSTGGSAGVVVGIDERREVALIRTVDEVVDADPLSFAAEEPEPGDEIVTIGYPKGRPQTPTSGTISRLGLSLDVKDQRLSDLVQFNADVSPGSSGGPLLNLAGEVVGMTEAGYTDADGLNYAVSSGTAQPLVDAWATAPVELPEPRCPKRSTVVHDRSGSPDGPGVAYFLRQYFDNLNEAASEGGTYASFDRYQEAFGTLSGRMRRELGPFDRFRDERLDVRHSRVNLVKVSHLDEVSDSAEVRFRRTEISPSTGREICRDSHYRYTVRLATGVWTLDDRKALSDNRKRC